MNKIFFQQKYFALSFCIAMLMVAIEVPMWLGFGTFGLMLWKWGSENYRWPKLSRRWTAGLSILFFIQVLLQYRTFIGEEPAYSFLLGLSALRVMDYQNDRDHKFLVLLGFVLLAVKALFSLDIYWLIPSAIAFGGVWYSLLPAGLPQAGKKMAQIILLSVPLAATLFVVFPRFVLPWAIARGNAYGQIGFSEELNPGRVADIVASSALAFRAKLTELPFKKSQDLYWRGSVLNISRGLSWRPQRVREVLSQELQPRSAYQPYEIAIVPTAQIFLFALEGTDSITMESGRVQGYSGAIFRATRPISATTVYRGMWREGGGDSRTPDARALEIPELRGQVAKWVEDANQRNLSIAQKLDLLKRFFSENGFIYTSQPGTYGANDLEEFLFVRRKGFCEHFAGAYATLARALGIPAQVVAGYQGGRFNPFAEFWKVSQRDAHAWVEVFNDSRWQRIDPTFWVAPLRLVMGGEDFLALSEADQVAFARDIDWEGASRKSVPAWEKISLWFESLNYRWNYFLLDYDRSSQLSLLAELGQNKVSIGLVLLCTGVLMALLFRYLYRTPQVRNESQQLLVLIESWGRRVGHERGACETPLIFLKRLSFAVPSLKDFLIETAEYYDRATYKGEPSERGAELVRSWRRLKS